MPLWIQTIDGAILLWIQQFLRVAVLTPLVELYTTLGDKGMIWIAASFILLCFRPTRRAGLLALFAMLLGLICNNLILKNLVARPRPYLTVAGLLPLLPPPDPNSFPSGHTCAAFACAAVWLRTLPWAWMRGLAVVLAALMGLSRLYVGVHYPSDVLVGGCVGFLCGLAVLWAARHWRRDAA